MIGAGSDVGCGTGDHGGLRAHMLIRDAGGTRDLGGSLIWCGTCGLGLQMGIDGHGFGDIRSVRWCCVVAEIPCGPGVRGGIGSATYGECQ